MSEIRGLIFPGGFTYGDYLGSGVIFSFILRAGIESALFNFIERKGKILGICNGFQILVRLSMLPFPGEKPSVSLEENASQRFECRWVPIIRNDSLIKNFRELPKSFSLPVAHLEGRLTFSGNEALERVLENGQAVFFYGVEKPSMKYSENPNGSQNGIAGISDPTGSILGLMPHPERVLDLRQYPFDSKSFKEPIGVTFMRCFFKISEE